MLYYDVLGYRVSFNLYFKHSNPEQGTDLHNHAELLNVMYKYRAPHSQ